MLACSHRLASPAPVLRLTIGCILGWAIAHFGSGLSARLLVGAVPRADAVLLSAMPGFAVAVSCVLALQISERPLRTGTILFLAAAILAALFVGGAAR